MFTPTGWDGSAAVRSAQPPDAALELNFVHGVARKTRNSSWGVCFIKKLGVQIGASGPS